MQLLLFPLLGALVLAAAYRLYGAFLVKRLEIDARNRVPAETMRDGVDFVPTPTAITLGHHFSSIAGAGPIVGPVIATLYFGWLPAIVWILLGSIFIGGVQDIGSLIASVRHRAASIPDLARKYIGQQAALLFLVFVWLALIYVIIVFLDLTAANFVDTTGGQDPTANAVANSSSFFVLLAVVLGFCLVKLKMPMLWANLIFVPLVFVGIWAGGAVDLAIFGEDPGIASTAWKITLLVYCLIASITPVWALLQPRDYLSSFLLYAAVIGGGIGLVLFAAQGQGSVTWPAVINGAMLEGVGATSIGPLFPILFITVACGACSGFHSIVASGTTARQVCSEPSAHRVGYGAMLVEGFVAIISVCTVVVLPFAAETFDGRSPIAVYAVGLGRFLSVFGLEPQLGAQFALLAVSTFLLTTLDTCTRLCRYITQDMLGWQNTNPWLRPLSTAIVLVIPAVAVFTTFTNAQGAPVPVWKAIWPVFGGANQLLGALALLAVTVWLKRTGRRYLFAALPMAFMFAVTLSALATNGFMAPTSLVGGICLGLFALGCLSLGFAIKALFFAPSMEKEELQQSDPAGDLVVER